MATLFAAPIPLMTDTVLPASPDTLYRQALGLLRAGNWPAALHCCQQAIEQLRQDDPPDAPRLAACLAQAGRAHWHHLALADSRECWAESLNWQDSTVVRGWLDEAERLLARQQAGETPPPAPEMDNPQALRLAYQAALLAPQDAPGLTRLGTLLMLHQRDAEAASYLARSLEIDPAQAQAASNLGLSLLNRKQYAQARSVLENALAQYPDDLHIQINLANALAQCGELAAAIDMHARVLARQPDDVHTLVNLASLEIRRHDYAQAQTYLDQALALAPQHSGALSAQADAWRFQHHFEPAIALLRTLGEREPQVAHHPRRLGSALRMLGRHAEAMAAYQRALDIEPGDADTYSNLLLALQYSPGYTPEQVFAWHRGFGERYEAPLPLPRHFPHSRQPERRLRVGWVSGDFNAHPVAYFVLPLWSALDRVQFESFAYDTSLTADSVTERLQAHVDHWRRVRGLTHEELARQIAHDRIDILIDLSGHTGGHRLPTFARKPAPVQAAWLGYADTTGLSRIDWRLSDPYGDPDGAEARYTERLWRLPEVFCCYQPMVRMPELRDSPDYAVQPTPALANGHITFGCCNNYSKITNEVIALWARLLHAAPQARLLLELAGISHEASRDELLARFAVHGIDAGRLQLEDRHPAWQYKRYHQIDICLDPFPATGGTSSCDLLWMGVPLVTLAGERFASRLGVSLLNAVGHAEWIAADADAYVDIALGLAAEVTALDAIRQEMRPRMEASPLMDAERFAGHFADALRGMWRDWCAQG